MFLLSINTRNDAQQLLPVIILFFSCLVFSSYTLAKKDEPLQVVVNSTYISVHTGPGRGYPIFHVLEKGETITLLYSKTDWIKISTHKGIEGWVKRSAMDDTIGPDGEVVALGVPRREDFSQRRWEIGVNTGAFDNSIEVLGVHTAYRFTKHVSTELRFAQATGRFSNNQLISWNLVHQPFPEWRLSPFFALGNGIVDISPNTNSTQEGTDDNFFMVGMGLNYYLSHRFMARIEYNNYTTLPDRDKNGNIDEWRLGITAFF